MQADFLQHIIDNPFDPHRRLVFSDWLEENGRINDAHDQRWMTEQTLGRDGNTKCQDRRSSPCRLPYDPLLQLRQTLGRVSHTKC
jgi:uncharacterized protein (TIGR02996 family)